MPKYFVFAVVFFVELTFVFAVPSTVPIIAPELDSVFRDKGSANVFITLKVTTSSVLAVIKTSQFHSRSDKLSTLYSALLAHSQNTQQPIQNYLLEQIRQQRGTFTIKSFWITNQIYIKNASQTLVSKLATNFPDLIESIDQEFFAHLIEPVTIQTNITLSSTEEIQWGVQKIQAPEAWEYLGGNSGGDVIVASIDTGVRGTHEALRHNFLGDYGWFDPSTGTLAPTDNNGHGTHTIGTIAGSKGIGVAPNVKWSACRGCPGVFCSQSNLLACGEFFTCPTLADGSKPDCSWAPHVVSNSWGGGRQNTWYNGVIDTWHAAGIIPIFSIGNSGPVCSTVSSPGDQHVIAVGSTMPNEAISMFSSAGPTVDGRIKPDISAPGSDVISAYHTADNAYASISGTSMACPHAAGTIALLKTRDVKLPYEKARELLIGYSDQAMRFSGRVCAGIRDNVFPNNVFGNGRINALKSLRALEG